MAAPSLTTSGLPPETDIVDGPVSVVATLTRSRRGDAVRALAVTVPLGRPSNDGRIGLRVLWSLLEGAGTARPLPLKTSGARKSVVAVTGRRCVLLNVRAPIATKLRKKRNAALCPERTFRAKFT
jgi:hypothetical protein